MLRPNNVLVNTFSFISDSSDDYHSLIFQFRFLNSSTMRSLKIKTSLVAFAFAFHFIHEMNRWSAWDEDKRIEQRSFLGTGNDADFAESSVVEWMM